jgi:hypothetical protein
MLEGYSIRKRSFAALVAWAQAKGMHLMEDGADLVGESQRL